MILNTISLPYKASPITKQSSTLFKRGLAIVEIPHGSPFWAFSSPPPTNQALQEELSKSTENPEKLVISVIGTKP
jgi:hypothetical protein